MAIGFDNATDRLQTAAPPSGSNWSIGFLFNPQVNLNAFAFLFALENSGATQYQEVGFNTSNQLSLYDTTNAQLLNFGTVTLNAWYWLFFCLGSGAADVYFGAAGTNPSLTKLTAGTVATVTTPNSLRFASTSANEYFNGYMHGIKIWSATKLTTAEVQAECADVQFVKTAGKWAFYPLHNNTLKLEDESGNMRVLTGSGGAWTNQTAPSAVPYSGLQDGTTKLFLRSQNLITTETDRKRLGIGQGNTSVNSTKTNHGTSLTPSWIRDRPLNTNSTNAGSPPFSLANIGWKIDPIDMGSIATSVRTIAAGTWTFDVTLVATQAQASALTTVQAEVWLMASGGATGTLLFSTTSGAVQVGTGATGNTANWTTGSQAKITFAAGETLQIEFYTNSPGVVVVGQTLTLRIENSSGGGTDSAVTFPALGSERIVSPNRGDLTITGYSGQVTRDVSANRADLTITSYGAAIFGDIAPNRADLTITSYAPAVDAGQTISADRGDLTITSYAPALDLTVSPDRADLTITSYAPAVQFQVEPNRADLAITSYTPELEQVISPNRGLIFLTTYGPGVEITIEPARADLTITSYGAAVEQAASVTRADLTITSYAPALEQQVDGQRADLTITSYAPAVFGDIAPLRADLTLTSYPPALDLTVDPNRGDLVITSYSGQVTRDVLANRGDLTITSYAPAIVQNVAPNRADLVITSYPAAVINAGAIDVLRADLALTSYGARVDLVIEGQRGDLTVTSYPPQVALTGTGQTIAAARADIGLLVIPPSLFSDIAPARADLTITSYAPRVDQVVKPHPGAITLTQFEFAVTVGDVSVAVDRADLALTSYPPGVRQVVTSNRAEIGLEAFAPAVSFSAAISPELGRIGLVIYPPEVAGGTAVVVAERFDLALNAGVPKLTRDVRVNAAALQLTTFGAVITRGQPTPGSMFDKPTRPSYPGDLLGAYRRRLEFWNRTKK